MLPTWMTNDQIESGKLVPLLENFPLDPPNTPIHAVFAHNRHLAPKVRAIVDFLAERMETGELGLLRRLRSRCSMHRSLK